VGGNPRLLCFNAITFYLTLLSLLDYYSNCF
jgi:hypothetical protein